MTEKERYEKIDLPFYREEVRPFLPEKILDFHTHIWTKDHWIEIPWEKDLPGRKYMVVEEENKVEDLLKDGEMIFPGLEYNAVCFSFPSPSIDLKKTNAYVAEACKERKNLFPLLLIGKDTTPEDEITEAVEKLGFKGFKVLTPWYGDDYGSITVKDMIGPREMEIADEYNLVVLLHVPRADRLADPEVQRDVMEYATKYPNAKLVLAHCGRCYLPEQILKAIRFLRELENIYLDTSMVMEPQVFQIILENLNPRRLLFGTDLPIARMRGRRVYVMNHWVDIVLEGYPESAYRVSLKGISAVFMVWEIVLALKRAAAAVGLDKEKFQQIFYENGMNLLRK